MSNPRAILERALVSGLYDLQMERMPKAPEAERLRRDVTQTEKRIRTLIRQQSDAAPSVASLYQDEINQLGTRLQALQCQLMQVESVVASADQQHNSRRMAFESIERDGLAHLWSLSPREINQILTRILGRLVFAVEGDRIVGLVEPRVGKIRRR